MAAVDLSRGAIAAISEGRGEEGAKPVVQVWDLRLVNTQQTTTERYRMLLSDGAHMQQAMLATQMNGIVKSGSLQKHSIVQLNEFICNVIQNRTRNARPQRPRRTLPRAITREVNHGNSSN